MAFSVAALFLATGTYNAIVINSHSSLNDGHARFVKRLDEVNGVVIEGRKVASSVKWQKLNPAKVSITSKKVISDKIVTETSAPVESIPAALVQEELSLSLVEVMNGKKWQNGLGTSDFSGSLQANAGVIEELHVSLPNGEGISVSFSEMTGNVFDYEMNGEKFSGMMYQVDQHAYMITLTNGPLEGTRMRFSSENTIEQQDNVQKTLAENNIEVGSFGEGTPASLDFSNETFQPETAQTQGFNFDEQVI